MLSLVGATNAVQDIGTAQVGIKGSPPNRSRRKARIKMMRPISYDQLPSVSLLMSYMGAAAARQVFVEQMGELKLTKGTVLMHEGDKGCNVFILCEGQCAVATEAERGKSTRQLRPGSVMGELSLLTGEPRSATVVVTSDTVSVLVAGRKLMTSSGLLAAIEQKRRSWEPFMQSQLPHMVGDLSPYDLSLLVDAIVVQTYADGAAITRAGAATAGVFVIVRDGLVVDATTNEELHEGACFGEAELLCGEKIDRCTRVAKGTVVIGTLSRHTFLTQMPLKSFAADHVPQQSRAARSELLRSRASSSPTDVDSSPLSTCAPTAGGEAKPDAGRASPVYPMLGRSVYDPRCSAESAATSSDASQRSFFSMGGGPDSPIEPVATERPAGDRPFVERPAVKIRRRRAGHSAETTEQTASFRRKGCLPGSAGPKSAQASAAIRKAVLTNAIFARLHESQLRLLEEAMVSHSLLAGTKVVIQGEKGDHFYIVAEGSLLVKVRPDDESHHNSPHTFGSAFHAPLHSGETIATIEAGEAFGELALMYNCPRTATVEAASPVKLWSLDRQTFRMIVLEANTEKTRLYEAFLSNVALLAPLTPHQKHRVIDALEEVTYAQGEVIIDEGAAGSNLYIIVDGEVSVRKEREELVRRGVGDYLGENSLLTGEPTNASVIAHSVVCKLVRLGRAAFDRLLGPLDALLHVRTYDAEGNEINDEQGERRGDADGGARWSHLPDAPHAELPTLPAPVSLADFSIVTGQIGRGAFATVRRCKHMACGHVLAMKQMSKRSIIDMGHVDHIVQEATILQAINHPFVTNCVAAFATAGSVFLVCELCHSDLFDVLHARRRFSVPDTRILSSQVLLAIEYLHERGVVHRDLKLENLLLAADGALKLADFGFAKVIQYRSWTLCGTPEYLAPEIILEKGHGKAVDYWAFGVLFYEMLNGVSPFEAHNPLKTYEKILARHVSYPLKMPKFAVDLTSRLLEHDTSKRLGNLVDGAADIRRHRFYGQDGFRWERAYEYRSSIMVEGFVPTVQEWVPATDEVLDKGACSEEESALFSRGFGFGARVAQPGQGQGSHE